MMVRLLAPSLDLSTMIATGMLDKSGGLTDKGFTYFASQFNNIPIEQVRKLAGHMVEASPGMAGIYQNFQSNNPRPLPVVGLDSSPASKPAKTAQDQLGDFLRPSVPAVRPGLKAAKRAAHGGDARAVRRQWAAARPGDKVVGPDGKTYTKGGADGEASFRRSRMEAASGHRRPLPPRRNLDGRAFCAEATHDRGRSAPVRNRVPGQRATGRRLVPARWPRAA